MNLVSWMCLQLLQPWFDAGHTLARLGIILIVLLVSGAAFLIVAHLLRMNEARLVLNVGFDLMSGKPASSPLIAPPEI